MEKITITEQIIIVVVAVAIIIAAVSIYTLQKTKNASR
jgi:hypothetical protein